MVGKMADWKHWEMGLVETLASLKQRVSQRAASLDYLTTKGSLMAVNLVRMMVEKWANLIPKDVHWADCSELH